MRRASAAVVALRPRKGRRKSEQKWTQKLLAASEEGDIERVETCLESGATVASSNAFGTALHNACRGGHLKIAKLLLEHDAPTDVLSDQDFSPLHLAVQRGAVELVTALLDAHADTNLRSRFERRSSLILAILEGWENLVHILLSKGADPSCTDLYGSTPMHYAAEKGNKSMIAILMKYGGSPSTGNKDGWTPLHLAASCGHVSVARELLKCNAG